MSRSGAAVGARYAAIDIGSNTVKLAIAEVQPDGNLISLFDGGVTTRIGEGMQSRRLGERPMQRTLDALTQCLGVCVQHGCARVFAVGTSALRDADNRDDFLQRARTAGLDVTVLSGEEEARLSGLAVRRDPLWRDAERLVVLDIGGGSTELTFLGKDDLSRSVSLQLGAVRLTERYLHGDPPLPAERRLAARAASRALTRVRLSGEDGCVNVVGVGGTVINMGSVAAASEAGGRAHVHGMKLTGKEVRRQIRLYAGLTTAQRKGLQGLDPSRADVILGGAIVLLSAIRALRVEHVSVSCRGLRWGVLYDRLAT